ncbi:flagellar hook-associated protein FlgL [Paenibacillus sp.]|uniref:flagellar hook-associated protein FlgL n=1 Tax=Paenibacillus sp. TaxID=58172 RepID=UPI002D51C944|nr:flagellar hook-associated protein FlgL [Paenibacillus sp.]HZG56545.1 flagellar hook-associated protein FlgL [Paenibacillus sp.]
MSLRVTQGMMNAQFLRNISNNIEKMNNLQNQLSTGRKINKPSDDPVGITFSMRYRSELSANDQFQRNVDSALSNLDYVDTMLGQAGSVLQRVRELAVKGASATNPDTAMESIRIEVDEMYKQLVDIGNSKFNGKYVFNGQLTNEKPYPDTGASGVDTDSGDLIYELGPGLKMPTNITGQEAFGASTDADNVFRLIEQLSADLANNDHDAVSGAIDQIDARMNKLLEARSEVGARVNRIELVQGRLNDIGINLENLQSKTEDADMTEVITKLKMGENVYQAALSTGAKLIQPSLVDFLR